MGPGLGPVFAVEWRLATRRWRLYAARGAFVGGLLIALVVTWAASVRGKDLLAMSIAEQAALGMSFYRAIAGTQLALVLMVAPAATAGAICRDKSTGTLTHLLVTDLTSREIVLGKLAGRLAPVIGLVMCALPVLAISTILGGIDPLALSGVLVATLGVAALGCSAALLMSVWGRKVHEVLLGTYGLIVLWLLSYPVWVMWRWSGWIPFAPPYWFGRANPFWLCFDTKGGDVNLGEFTAFAAGSLAISGVFAAVAVRSLRPVAMKEAGQAKGAKPVGRMRLTRWRGLRWLSFGWIWRRFPEPSLDGNPVLWREWSRTNPSGWSSGVWGFYALAATAVTIMVVFDVAAERRTGMEIGAILGTGCTVMIGLMLMCLSAPTSLAEERAQGSLDVLVATPLSAREIVYGKWLGTFRYILPIALLPTIIVGSLSWRSGHLAPIFLMPGYVLTIGATLTSLGLALAVWLERPGRAVAVTLALFVLVTVGWVILMAALINDNLGAGLACASPFMAAAIIGSMCLGGVGPGSNDRAMLTTCLVFWTIGYAVIAWILFEVSTRTFDRCLGRMEDDADEGLGRAVSGGYGIGYEPTAAPRVDPLSRTATRL